MSLAIERGTRVFAVVWWYVDKWNMPSENRASDLGFVCRKVCALWAPGLSCQLHDDWANTFQVSDSCVYATKMYRSGERTFERRCSTFCSHKSSPWLTNCQITWPRVKIPCKGNRPKVMADCSYIDNEGFHLLTYCCATQNSVQQTDSQLLAPHTHCHPHPVSTSEPEVLHRILFLTYCIDSFCCLTVTTSRIDYIDEIFLSDPSTPN